MRARNKPVEKCITEKDKLQKLEALPRDVDTFWCTDRSPPPSTLSGKMYLTYRIHAKGMAFTHRERQLLSIQGLMPPAVLTIDQQVEVYQKHFATLTSKLAKYIFLTDLEAANRKLFYRLLMSNPFEYMRVFLSAESGDLVEYFSHAYTTFRGMFVTIKDRGHIYEILGNWPFRRSTRCLIVSTGKSVLSWGDKGVNGTPIIHYKMFANVVLGGIDPNCCLPVTLDLGTDNEALLQDKQYIGLKQKRVAGKEYDEFFEEFTLSVMRLFGPRAIIQTKDIGSLDSLRHLAQYRSRQCIMDIDLQCLGACGVAGVLGARQITQMAFKDNTLLFHGVSTFNVGMAQMCVAYLKRSGLNEAAAKSRIWFYDGKGLVVHNRCGLRVPEQLHEFQQVHEAVEGLVESIDAVKPNILVGCGKMESTFTKDVLRAMERSAQTPIIFAMSRPAQLAECTANDAFVHTKGRCIFISGIPVAPLKYANKEYQPGYCSGDYMLSGLTQGVLLSGMTTVPDETFLVAAERLASLVWPTDLAKRDVYPPLRKLRCINLHIADAVFTLAYRRGLATLWPEPKNPIHYIKSMLYDLEYTESVPEVYSMCDHNIGTAESLQYYKEKI
ncbi:hypothetical protein ACLKA6_007753 [Drosophila palustris]